jgi:hypothetical protein
MFVITFLIYFMGPNSSADHLEHFGQVGDFFGGMLNPALAFASLIALLYTIRIQSEELRLTREEFSKSVKAQEQLVRENKHHQKTLVLSNASEFVANRYLEKITKAQSIFDEGLYFTRVLGGTRTKIVPKNVFNFLVQCKMSIDIYNTEYMLDLAIAEYCSKENVFEKQEFNFLLKKTIQEIRIHMNSAVKCGRKLESLSNLMQVEELSDSIHSVSIMDLGWLYGVCAFINEDLAATVTKLDHDDRITFDLVVYAREFLTKCGCVLRE